jgi:gamma-glutamyltranspeptidase/glutathione hydrolase
MVDAPLERAFGRAAEPWLDFDPTRSRPARGRAAVAAANPLAAWAALRIVRGGGSAVDAAVAAQVMLTLVEPNASGIGGGAMIMVHDGSVVVAIDGLSAAPARVPDRLETDFDGRSVPADRAAYGGRTVGVPGALRALEHAHRRYGRLPWQALFAPAIERAAEGFPLAPYVVRTLLEIPSMRDEPFARALYCGGGTLPLAAGTMLRNPALARTLEAIAAGGADAFYRGDLAERMAAAAAADAFAGTLTAADFAAYAPVKRRAPVFHLGEWLVATAPLPAYGGIAAGQLVGIAARHGVGVIGHDLGEEEIHILAEAGRVAFADREPYADPDHAPLDVDRLLDPAYLARRARHVDRARRNERIPAGHTDGLGASMTSHVAIADGAGQVVSMTTTINQNFGARIAVEGFYLNNVLTNFAAVPVRHGKRVANAMAPGKRPRSSIGPCIVMDASGRPLAALGAGGGFRIIGYVANTLLRLAGGGTDPQAILAAPHAMNWSGTTEVEPPLARHVPGLVARGHWVTTRRLDGGTQCVLADGADWVAGGDPRRDGVGMALRR